MNKRIKCLGTQFMVFALLGYSGPSLAEYMDNPKSICDGVEFFNENVMGVYGDENENPYNRTVQVGQKVNLPSGSSFFINVKSQFYNCTRSDYHESSTDYLEVSGVNFLPFELTVEAINPWLYSEETQQEISSYITELYADLISIEASTNTSYSRGDILEASRSYGQLNLLGITKEENLNKVGIVEDRSIKLISGEISLLALTRNSPLVFGVTAKGAISAWGKTTIADKNKIEDLAFALRPSLTLQADIGIQLRTHNGYSYKGEFNGKESKTKILAIISPYFTITGNGVLNHNELSDGVEEETLLREKEYGVIFELNLMPKRHLELSDKKMNRTLFLRAEYSVENQQLIIKTNNHNVGGGNEIKNVEKNSLIPVPNKTFKTSIGVKF